MDVLFGGQVGSLGALVGGSVVPVYYGPRHQLTASYIMHTSNSKIFMMITWVRMAVAAAAEKSYNYNKY